MFTCLIYVRHFSRHWAYNIRRNTVKAIMKCAVTINYMEGWRERERERQ
jgi:hypothetical protein